MGDGDGRTRTVAYSKRVLNEVFEPELDEKQLDHAFEICWSSADFAKGRLARTEKRPPVSEGR